MNPAARPASDSQRRPSSVSMSSWWNARNAWRTVGVPAAGPSVIRRDNPSRRRSAARGGGGGGGPRLWIRDKAERLVGRTRLLGCLGRGESPAGATRRFGCQRGGTLEERGGGGEAAPCQRSGCRTLELGGHLLIRHRGRLRPVPGAAIGVDLRIGRVRQRAVDLPPLVGPGGPVHRGASERMTEHHT